MKNMTDFTPWPASHAQQYRELGYWQGKTLVDYLYETVEKSGDNTAIICGQRYFSYRDMKAKIVTLARGLTRIGLQAGDNVVLQMTNTAEFYFYFFALVQKGIRPVMALPAHRLAEIQYFCQHAEAKAYLIDGDAQGFNYQVLAHQVLETCPSLEWVIVNGDRYKNETQCNDARFVSLTENGLTENGLTEYEWTEDKLADNTGMESELIPKPTPEVSASDIAFFQLSGGTTGTPKLIPRTHDDYAYSVTGSVEICRFSAETRFLCVLPVAHNYPFSSPGALGVFWAGGCVVIGQDATPQTAFELIEKHQINFVSLVPPLALLWMDHAAQSSRDISCLAVVQVGGAKLSETVASQLPEKLGCQLQQVFGMAEGLVNYTRLDDPLHVITQTQGRPISSHDQIRVVDESGQNVASGQEGLLLTQGPYTIRGYYRAPAHNARSFTVDGFYRTGDRVRLTADGNIVVTGRDKDQINRGGEKIAAEEVENQLLRHASIHDAALIAMPDPYLGERSCAVVVLYRDVPAIRPVALKQFLRQCGLAEYKIPDQIQFVETLPKTSVGKINKKKLRAMYAPTPTSV